VATAIPICFSCRGLHPHTHGVKVRGSCRLGTLTFHTLYHFKGGRVNPTVLRTNATAVGRFLSILTYARDADDALNGKRILDCGAGGPVPPLAVFAEQGLEAHGIDISETQLEKARAYCSKKGLEIEFKHADMRELPYPDEFFDFVYEHFSICHLNPEDTAKTLAEMWRVLKPEGIAFFGVISTDCWPLSSYGKERNPGEYWMVENGEERFHAVYTDAQSDALVADWELEMKQKVVHILREQGEAQTEDQWRALHAEAIDNCSLDEWMSRYPNRANAFTYVHTYYIISKPEDA